MIRHCCCCTQGDKAFNSDCSSVQCQQCHIADGYPHFERRHDPVTDHEAALEWLLREVAEIRVELRQLKIAHR